MEDRRQGSYHKRFPSQTKEGGIYLGGNGDGSGEGGSRKIAQMRQRPVGTEAFLS